MPSLVRGWITATLSMSALKSHCCIACSLYKTQLPVSSLERENVTTSLQSWPRSTGSRCLLESILRFCYLLFKPLNGLAPQYLSELLQLHAPTRALRSANQLLLVAPKTRLKPRGDRAFGAAAPRLWNSLPWHIRSAQTLELFTSSLKTHLFSQAFNSG